MSTVLKQKHILKLVGFDMFVIEFGPVGVFFLAYYLSNFSTAALALAIAILATLFLSKAVNKRVPWFAIFSGGVTIVTALVTYLYDAPWVLILRDTIYYLFFAALLGISLRSKASLFEKFFGHVFAISEKGWRVLEKRWGIFLFIAAILNEYVRMYMSLEAWVMYKQVLLVAMGIFGMYQFKVSMRYRTEEADSLGLRKVRSKQENE